MQVNCNLSDHVQAITVPRLSKPRKQYTGLSGEVDGATGHYLRRISRGDTDLAMATMTPIPRGPRGNGKIESLVHIRGGALRVLRSYPRRVFASPSFPFQTGYCASFVPIQTGRCESSFPSATGCCESFLPIRDGTPRILRSCPKPVTSFPSNTGCCESFLPIQDRSLRVFVPIRDGSLRTRPLFTSETGCRGSFIHIRDGSLQRECPFISFSETQWNNYLFVSVAIRPYP